MSKNDELRQLLLSFPPEKAVSAQEYDKQAQLYVKRVESLPQSTWQIRGDKKSLLEDLDPVVNSIPYLLCLLVSLRAANNNSTIEEILPHLSIFFQSFEAAQIRHVGAQWRELFALTVESFRQIGERSISPLGDALLRLDTICSTFTTSHLLYLRLCLQASTPSKALKVLDKDIYVFPTTTKNLVDETHSGDHDHSSISQNSDLCGKLTAEMVLEYYLLGAHVYMGQRNWLRARLFLEHVITHPSASGTTSILQAEAYKKWVLTGLLAQGKTYTFPRTVGQQVTKNLKSVARPYDTLAETFEKRDWRKFQAEVDVGSGTWTQDGNFRSVNEASSTLLQYCVADLRKIYVALPMTEVAKHLGMPIDNASTLVTQLITSGQLKATIENTSTNGTALRFSPADDTPAITDVLIEEQTERIDSLVRAIRDASRRLQLSKEYIEILRRAKRQGPEGDPADQMDLDWNAPGMPMVPVAIDDGDEDIMA